MIRYKFKMTLMLTWMLLLPSLYAQSLSLELRPTLELSEQDKIIYVGKNVNGEIFLGIVKEDWDKKNQRITSFLLKTIDGQLLYETPTGYLFNSSAVSSDNNFILLALEKIEKPIEKINAYTTKAKYVLLSTNGKKIYEEEKLWEFEQERAIALSNNIFFIRLNSEVSVYKNDGVLIDKIDLSNYRGINHIRPALLHLITDDHIYFAINYSDRNEQAGKEQNLRPVYKAKLLSYNIFQKKINIISNFEDDEKIYGLVYFPAKKSLYVYSLSHGPRGDVLSTKLTQIKDTEREVLFELENSKMDALEKYLVFTRYQSFRVLDTNSNEFIFEIPVAPLKKVIINDTLYMVTAQKEEPIPTSNRRGRRTNVTRKLLAPELTIVDLNSKNESKITLTSFIEFSVTYNQLNEIYINENSAYIPFYNKLFIVGLMREWR